MVDEIKKSEAARQERIRQEAQEKAKAKPKESEFDRLVKEGQASQAGQAAKVQSKPITEQAMEEAAKRQEKEQEMRQKDKEERKEKKETRETGEKADAKVAQHKVVGKGPRGQGGRGGGGKGGGYQGSTTRRGLTKQLAKAGVKTLPADLQKKFAAKMAQLAKDLDRPDGARLNQEVLNKIVQYVRIGINRKGEKEIQLDLHERIFRGLRLRVTEKGGRVSVHFRTFDEKGRAVFERNSDAIRDALAKRGIEVEEITVA